MHLHLHLHLHLHFPPILARFVEAYISRYMKVCHCSWIYLRHFSSIASPARKSPCCPTPSSQPLWLFWRLGPLHRKVTIPRP
jgi:hypothetical protein